MRYIYGMQITGDSKFENFQSSLQLGGERAALEYLSSLTGFRFVALIYYQDGRGHPLHYFDRSNPDLIAGEEIDQRASYCSTVLASGRIFQTSDSLQDERLAGHPARDFVKAYFGVPLFAPDGGVQAVLCHFDVVPRDSSLIDAQLLTQAGAEFQKRLSQYRLALPLSEISHEHAERLGNTTLYVVERRRAEWTVPRYSVERTKTRADGRESPRQVYGRDGFASFDEALEFGRQWCQPDGPAAE
jgi:GAF domain-containing protein